MAICESCGREEATVIKVQRVYLLPGDDAGAGPGGTADPSVPAAGDIEHWCASCCATFPHTIVRAE